LDSNLSPLALGLPGEIYIGGPGLSRGYLRQPGITAERFIPDPHSDTPGARLYKTGDIGTYRNNGDIEFGGRLDNQIKLRGYRIELDEVEHALRQHPAIHDVLVTMQEEESDEKRLVAYIVGQPSNAAEAPPMAASDQTGADQEGALNSISLRGFLRKRMPEYMIPSAFEFLDQFPLLPNGKINRKQLPKPGSNGARDAKSFAPPTSALELQIASLWGEMLKVSRVGIDDNFFDLGGHSFLAIKMHYQLCQDLKLDVPLLKLFEHPTVRKLAQFLEQEQKPSPDAFRPNQVDNWAAHRRAALQQQRELIQKTS
jgi:acyl carrier protein